MLGRRIADAPPCSTSGRQGPLLAAKPAASSRRPVRVVAQPEGSVSVQDELAASPASPPRASTSQLVTERPPRNLWTYKYPHAHCEGSMCRGDRRCCEVEALVQNVLGFPRLPPRTARLLPGVTAPLAQITDTVERMAEHFGQERSLYFLRRQPYILDVPFQLQLERCAAAQAMLGLRPSELPMLLRKNPRMLVVAQDELRLRFDAIPRAIDFKHDQVRQLVIKYPLVLNFSSEGLRAIIDALRQIAYTRDMWQRDFEAITPSLLAFYVRDHVHLLQRLEFLTATGDAMDNHLREVFKVSDFRFGKLHPSFRKWRTLVKRRQAQQDAAEAAAAAAGAVAAAEIRSGAA